MACLMRWTLIYLIGRASASRKIVPWSKRMGSINVNWESRRSTIFCAMLCCQAGLSKQCFKCAGDHGRIRCLLVVVVLLVMRININLLRFLTKSIWNIMVPFPQFSQHRALMMMVRLLIQVFNITDLLACSSGHFNLGWGFFSQEK